MRGPFDSARVDSYDHSSAWHSASREAITLEQRSWWHIAHAGVRWGPEFPGGGKWRS